MTRRAHQQEMVILGIDPGHGRMGWGIARIGLGKPRALAYGCIETSPKHAEEQRLVTIYNALNRIIQQFHPAFLGIEQLFFSRNVTTAFSVAQARGVACLLAGLHHVPILTVSPSSLKLAVTGYGKANKHQVQFMVQKLYNVEEIPKPDDAADALAVAYAVAITRQTQHNL